MHVGSQHVDKAARAIGRTVERFVMQVEEHAVPRRAHINFDPRGTILQCRIGRGHRVLRSQRVGTTMHYHLNILGSHDCDCPET